MSDIKEITQELEKFRDERDWEQFHNPKDLAYEKTITLLALYCKGYK